MLIALMMAMLWAPMPYMGDAALPGQVIDVVGDNYFFRAPSTIRPGLTTFRFSSPHGGHELMVYRLDSGYTASDLVKALAEDAPPHGRKLGGPAFPRIGGSMNATYVLDPGQYVLLCFSTERGDTLRHFQKGMFSALTVVGRRVAGRLPAPDLEISLDEYHFTFSRPLVAGRHVMRVANTGNATHELKFLRVLPGHTTEQSINWKRGEPPVDEQFGAITSVDPGMSIITTMDFPPGDYVVICVLQTRKGHVMREGLHVTARMNSRSRMPAGTTS
ncbi:MAG: hypothetical protein ABIY52_06395 [Gemmatimonadaceae bacterium]